MNHGTSPVTDSILPVLRKIDEVERQLLARLDQLKASPHPPFRGRSARFWHGSSWELWWRPWC
jgi:hypothetical protein